jgi:hypothetical protein
VVRVSETALDTMIDTCSLLAPLYAIKNVHSTSGSGYGHTVNWTGPSTINDGDECNNGGRCNLSDTPDMQDLSLYLVYLWGLVISKVILTLRP